MDTLLEKVKLFALFWIVCFHAIPQGTRYLAYWWERGRAEGKNLSALPLPSHRDRWVDVAVVVLVVVWVAQWWLGL